MNGIEMGYHKWNDTLFLRYSKDTLDLPTYCAGWNTKYFICHTLDCKKGGLITTRHTKLRDGVTDLTGKSFTHLHVRDNTLINQGHAVQEGKAHTAGYPTKNPPGTTEELDQKGETLICDLWKRVTDSIHNMRFLSTGALSNWKKSP